MAINLLVLGLLIRQLEFSFHILDHRGCETWIVSDELMLCNSMHGLIVGVPGIVFYEID